MVCRYFDIHTQEQYHDLYLWTDALALADCMFGMREGWRKFCGLDLFKSITLPSASYSAMLQRLKRDNVTLELIAEENAGWELMNKLDEYLTGGLSCIF